ncbi:MAG: DUF4118 domain-containing protein, partial [Candidatus Omnitrophica bacterium]|nr:DUF4118 domain-containing protein [Candidatus Omnitrophota bacterium]
ETKWQRLWGIPTLADRLVELSGQIDVHMVRMSSVEKNFPAKPQELFYKLRPREYGISFLMFAIATVVNLILQSWVGYEATGLIYLLTVVLSGSFLGRSAAFMLAALSALAWDFLFIPPKFMLTFRSSYDMGLLGMFFITGLMMGYVTSKLRRQKEIEQKQRQRSESLYELTKALALSTDITQAMRVATAQINLLLSSLSMVFMLDENEQPVFAHPIGDVIEMTENQKGMVQWVAANKKAAGRFSDTLPQQPLMYLPLMSSGQVRAVAVIKLLNEKPLDLAQRTLLESFTALMTVMLEKDQLLKISHEAKMKEDTQNLQSALLDNLSHELKTPLTIISGYLDALILFHQWPKDALELLEECRLACLRLTNGVDAVLDLTKLDVGNLRPNFAWCEVKDIVTQALKQVGTPADEKRIQVDYPQGPLYANADFYMITQALKNIIHNALIHGPEGEDIYIHVRVIDQKIRISVIDQGEGISKETLNKIFDKFYRGSKTRKGGLGLGLSIARRFVQLNEGEIEAENLSPQGFMVTITLPMVEKE